MFDRQKQISSSSVAIIWVTPLSGRIGFMTSTLHLGRFSFSVPPILQANSFTCAMCFWGCYCLLLFTSSCRRSYIYHSMHIDCVHIVLKDLCWTIKLCRKHLYTFSADWILWCKKHGDSFRFWRPVDSLIPRKQVVPLFDIYSTRHRGCSLNDKRKWVALYNACVHHYGCLNFSLFGSWITFDLRRKELILKN